ncbi:MAG: hypothetical protein Q9N34_03370 [Aquificota bacterium]|nr:hypothetical protein [Aquificota bacterium]
MESVKEKLSKRKKLVFGALLSSLILSLVGSMLWSLLSLLSASAEDRSQKTLGKEEKPTLYPDEDWKAVMERRMDRLQERLESIESLLKSMKASQDKTDAEPQKFRENIQKPEVTKKEHQPELPPIKIKLEEPVPKPVNLGPQEKGKADTCYKGVRSREGGRNREKGNLQEEGEGRALHTSGIC